MTLYGPLPVGPSGPVDDIEFTREDLVRALAGDFDEVQVQQEDGTFRTVADLFKDLDGPCLEDLV